MGYTLIVSAVLTSCNIVLPIATQLVQEYIHIVSNTTMIKVATTMLWLYLQHTVLIPIFDYHTC